MNKRISIPIFILVLLAIVVGVVMNNKNEPKKTIRVGYLSILTGAPHFIAIDQKFYEKEGLNIEGTQFQSSNQLYDAIAKGDIDITPEVSVLPVLINHIKDSGKVKIFTTTEMTTQDPFDQLIVKNDSTITKLSDLAGKKIGVFPGSTATAFLKDYLIKNGVDVSKIEFIQIPPQNQLQALEVNSIQALHAYEPNIATGLVKLKAKTLGSPVYSSYLENNPIGVGIVSAKFAAEQPRLAKKVIRIYDKSFDFLLTNDSESRNVLIKEMKIDPEVAKVMNLIYQTKSTDLDKNHFQKFVDILIELKELPSQPDLSTIFY